MQVVRLTDGGWLLPKPPAQWYVPVPSNIYGEDSLLSIVQMPKGVPVATFAIGEAGAANAALFAISLLANHDAELAQKLADFRTTQEQTVLAMTLPGSRNPIIWLTSRQ